MSVVGCAYTSCTLPFRNCVQRERDDAIVLFDAIQRRCTIHVFLVVAVQVVYYVFSSAAGSDVTLDTFFLLFLHVLSVMTG